MSDPSYLFSLHPSITFSVTQNAVHYRRLGVHTSGALFSLFYAQIVVLSFGTNFRRERWISFFDHLGYSTTMTPHLMDEAVVVVLKLTASPPIYQVTYFRLVIFPLHPLCRCS